MRNKIPVLIFGLCVILLYFTACKEKIEYGDISGTATGKIDFSGETPDVTIDNIIADAGEEIDYTSEILLEGVEELGEYQISVNASDVVPDQPGNYTATYKIIHNGETYTKQVTVTIKEPGIEREDTSETLQPSTTPSQTTQSPVSTTQSTEQTITSVSSQTERLQAEIELLSGELVSIKYTNSKYIVSTRTDVSRVTRNGIEYEVQKLIITFNTGEQQVLETVEKKIN